MVIGGAAELAGNFDPFQDIQEPVSTDPVQLAMRERDAGLSRCLAQPSLKVLSGVP